MAVKNNTQTVAPKEVVENVLKLLAALSRQHSLEPLKQLFWSELNYERANRPLSRRDWPDKAAAALLEDPLLFATGGNDDGFHVIYLHLAVNELSLGDERSIVTQLLKDHLDALFIFSNAVQNKWHFLNVKHDSKDTRRRLFRRFTIGLEERLRTASEQIAMLNLASISQASRFDIIQQHEKAFDVEAVTGKFFDEYRKLFRIIQVDLDEQTNDNIWAHDYALQFLNRCMFLYFIQRKGWLGNDKEFLRSFWQSYNKGSNEKDTFFNSWIQVLFFEAFNNRFQGGYTYFPQHIQDVLVAAPYLNGGLFSPTKLDAADYSFNITDALFQQVFDFFEHYNFTIAEDSPLDQEVAVDPEMIGRVYESLVNVSTEVDERSDAGIFYTPRTEIDLMCRLSLVDYLANHIGQDKKPLLYDTVFALEPEEKSSTDDTLKALKIWDALKGLLREVTVVDPACGSGAFLVGMLYVLNDLQERAERYCDTREHESPYERKKRIIGQSLYGVDVMEWAAHIAELRLWLTLVIDVEIPYEELHVRRDPLLPHLTFKIRYGDSLVQEIGDLNFGLMQATTGISPMLKRRLSTLKAEKIKFYHNDPSCTFKTREAALQEEQLLFRALVQERSNTIDMELLVLGNQPEQAELITGLGAQRLQAESIERQKQIDEKESEMHDLDRVLRALDSPKHVPFVWDIAFVEIFGGNNDGFDIVIGNPPYVRQEQISDPHLSRDEITPENKKVYKRKLANTVYHDFPDFFRHKQATGKASHEINVKSDLYIYFYLHGLRLLNPRGSFCFITSNSWLDVGYGADLQEFLLKYDRIKMILDNQAKRSFATADVNTVIVLFSAPTTKLDAAVLNNIARFVMFKVDFAQILTSDVFKKIELAQVRTNTPEYRVYPITQKTLLEDGLEQPEHNKEEDAPPKSNGKMAPTRLLKDAQGNYLGNKWGGKYLRAPDIYWTILKKGEGKLKRLGDVAEVRFGIKSGANEFFYLDELRIKEYGIEEEFLRSVIKSPRECKRIQIDPANLKFKIFMCHLDRKSLEGTAALEYIKWGEQQGFHLRPSCSGRLRWWDLGERRIPPIISPSSVSELARTFRNNGVLADKRMYEIYPYGHENAVLLATNTTLSSLFLEIGSRTGLGEGLLDLTVYELADCLVALPPESELLDKVLLTTSQRTFLPLKDELQHPNRKAIDDFIFNIIGLSQGEQEAVYEAVIGLVETRLKKAKSLEPEKQPNRMEI